MTKPIKVNYTDDNGKRTSTTISYAVAFFYGRHCNQIDNNLRLEQALTQAVQKFVNNNEYCTNKHAIESMLLFQSEIQIELLLNKKYKSQQPDLFQN